jgi:hypothetical protein
MTIEIEFCSSERQQMQQDIASLTYGSGGVSLPVLLEICLHILSGIEADPCSKMNSYRSQFSRLCFQGL